MNDEFKNEFVNEENGKITENTENTENIENFVPEQPVNADPDSVSAENTGNTEAQSSAAEPSPAQSAGEGDAFSAGASFTSPPQYVQYAAAGSYRPQYQAPAGNTPYAAYPSGTQFSPEGPKGSRKPSKGKKKGLIIAASVLGAAVLVSLVVIIASFVFSGSDNSVGTPDTDSDTKTQLNFSETPTAENSSGEDGILTAGQVYDKVCESSVGIIVYSGNYQSAASEGSGIVMGTDDSNSGSYIITCAHVIDVSNPRILVQTTDGTQYDAEVVGIDSKTDIGLIYVASTDLKAAEFADSSAVSVGDTVYAIGNPGGTQFFGSFTNGMISAIARPVDSPVGYEVKCIQHTAAINPGNSGGALVNEYGQVIGINSSKIASTDYEGMGFAVPSATVKEIVDQLIANGAVTNRPVLGITFEPVTSNQTYSIIAQTNKLPSGTIIVASVMNGSDMLNKGVKEGDMITAVNGEELDDYNTLLDLVENGKVGDALTLTICRMDSDYQLSYFDIDVKLVSDATVEEETEESSTVFPFPFNQ